MASSSLVKTESKLDSSRSILIKDVDHLQGIFSGSGKEESLRKDIVRFYEHRKNFYPGPVSLTQLISDYNQHSAQIVSQHSLSMLEQYNANLESLKEELAALEAKATAEGSFETSPEGLTVVSLEGEDKELKERLERKIQKAENLYRSRFEIWIKLWSGLRQWEEKRLDREVPKKVQSLNLNLSPSQVAEFVKQQQEQ